MNKFITLAIFAGIFSMVNAASISKGDYVTSMKIHNNRIIPAKIEVYTEPSKNGELVDLIEQHINGTVTEKKNGYVRVQHFDERTNTTYNTGWMKTTQFEYQHPRNCN